MTQQDFQTRVLFISGDRAHWPELAAIAAALAGSAYRVSIALCHDGAVLSASDRAVTEVLYRQADVHSIEAPHAAQLCRLASRHDILVAPPDLAPLAEGLGGLHHSPPVLAWPGGIFRWRRVGGKTCCAAAGWRCWTGCRPCDRRPRRGSFAVSGRAGLNVPPTAAATGCGWM